MEITFSKYWSLNDAVALCVEIEKICPSFGCHVALTGGVLYKGGLRKDCDLLLYRIRQSPKIDFDGLWPELAKLGIEKKGGFGFCHKAEFKGRELDFLSPEEEGEYVDADEKVNLEVNF